MRPGRSRFSIGFEATGKCALFPHRPQGVRQGHGVMQGVLPASWAASGSTAIRSVTEIPGTLVHSGSGRGFEQLRVIPSRSSERLLPCAGTTLNCLESNCALFPHRDRVGRHAGWSSVLEACSASARYSLIGSAGMPPNSVEWLHLGPEATARYSLIGTAFGRCLCIKAAAGCAQQLRAIPS